MQEIYVENIKKIFLNKKKLEKELKIKLTNKGKNVFTEGNPENEYTAIDVLQAINLGFSVDHALTLKQENTIFQTLNIKNITKRNGLERVRARIIGTHGKTLKAINNLTTCLVSMKDNKIGIIGNTEEIEDAVQAITSIIHGSKQGNVYARLERQRKYKKTNLTEDLDIKNELNEE